MAGGLVLVLLWCWPFWNVVNVKAHPFLNGTTIHGLSVSHLFRFRVIIRRTLRALYGYMYEIDFVAFISFLPRSARGVAELAEANVHVE